jgi:hypothetical protein
MNLKSDTKCKSKKRTFSDTQNDLFDADPEIQRARHADICNALHAQQAAARIEALIRRKESRIADRIRREDACREARNKRKEIMEEAAIQREEDNEQRAEYRAEMNFQLTEHLESLRARAREAAFQYEQKMSGYDSNSSPIRMVSPNGKQTSDTDDCVVDSDECVTHTGVAPNENSQRFTLQPFNAPHGSRRKLNF